MHTAGFVLHTGIILYLVFGEPYWGKQKYAELTRSVAHDPTARVRFYNWVLALEWGLVLLAVLGMALQGQGLAWLGFRPLPTEGEMVFLQSTFALGSAVGLVLPVLMARLHSRTRAALRAQLEALGPLLPRTAAERWLLAAVSVTAGICEEMLFRGLLIGWLVALWPGMSPVLLGLISAAVFGLAHLYQGWKGVLQSGLMGGLFAWLYLVTGSLYLPMLLHTLIDLRMLALVWVVEERA